MAPFPDSRVSGLGMGPVCLTFWQESGYARVKNGYIVGPVCLWLHSEVLMCGWPGNGASVLMASFWGSHVGGLGMGPVCLWSYSPWRLRTAVWWHTRVGLPPAPVVVLSFRCEIVPRYCSPLGSTSPPYLHGPSMQPYAVHLAQP